VDIGIVKYTEEKDHQEHNISILSVSCTEVTCCAVCRKDVGQYDKDITTIKCQNETKNIQHLAIMQV